MLMFSFDDALKDVKVPTKGEEREFRAANRIVDAFVAHRFRESDVGAEMFEAVERLVEGRNLNRDELIEAVELGWEDIREGNNPVYRAFFELQDSPKRLEVVMPSGSKTDSEIATLWAYIQSNEDDSGGEVWASSALLARLFLMSRRHIDRINRYLVKRGVLTLVTEGYYSQNPEMSLSPTYRVTVDVQQYKYNHKYNQQNQFQSHEQKQIHSQKRHQKHGAVNPTSKVITF